MKHENEILGRIYELEIKEKEILELLLLYKSNTFEYRVQYDILIEVQKRISDLKWVLS